MAESFLATGPRDLSGSDRQQIVVHVDAVVGRAAEARLRYRQWLPAVWPKPIPITNEPHRRC